MTRTPLMQISNLTKAFGLCKQNALEMADAGYDKDYIYKKTGSIIAVNNASFDVEKGQVFALIGLSGSGKSTLIRCLNMLQEPSRGSIMFENENIVKYSDKQLRSFRRNKTSMVFQSFSLMTHRNVISNVAFGLEIRGFSKSQRESRAMEIIKMVGLEGYEYQSINSLSGGMKQRVGIARALINDPEVLLMDEPFSALDPLVRKDLQFELLSLQKKLAKSIVFITHDINEAFKLGDKVGIMHDGKILQVASPEEMLVKPYNNYVKKFTEGVDRTKILCARHIMRTPSCIVKDTDGPHKAINEMRENGVSSVYVLGDKLNLLGIITLDDALSSLQQKQHLSITKKIPTVNPDTAIADIIPIAAQAPYPIAVIDDERILKGIITKASVLSLIA